MELNNKYTNLSPVGINFFENLPPVGTKNPISRWEQITQPPQRTNNKVDKSITTGNSLNKKQGKVLVKGFGNTALFTIGLLMASKRQGFQVRLDGLNAGNSLSNADQICHRNPVIVKNYYETENIEKPEPRLNTRFNEDIDLDITGDTMDEIFASDYSKKYSKLTKKLEVDI